MTAFVAVDRRCYPSTSTLFNSTCQLKSIGKQRAVATIPIFILLTVVSLVYTQAARSGSRSYFSVSFNLNTTPTPRYRPPAQTFLTNNSSTSCSIPPAFRIFPESTFIRSPPNPLRPFLNRLCPAPPHTHTTVYRALVPLPRSRPAETPRCRAVS